MAEESKIVNVGYGGLIGTEKPNSSIWDKTEMGARWHSTGKGHFPKITMRPGGEGGSADAYLVLHDQGVAPEFNEINPDKTRNENVLRLWVHEFSLSWEMEYATAQTAFGRSFYPRHIRYPDVTIKAQTASQQHFDEIVERLLKFQARSIIPGTTGSPSRPSNPASTDVVRFYMPSAKYVNNYKNPQGFRGPRENGYKESPEEKDAVLVRYPDIRFDGYPIAFSAGHRKGVFNPEIEITFTVITYTPRDLEEAVASTPKDYVQELLTSFTKPVTSSNPAIESGYAFDPGYGPGGNLGPKG